MTAEQIKIKVKESFADVESEGFLNAKIAEGVTKHYANYFIWKGRNSNGNISDWIQLNVDSVNLNSKISAEIMAIGIFLLSLDEFQKQLNEAN